MEGFYSETFIQQDPYMTPKYALENIQHLIPKNKLSWEAFYGEGSGGQHLKELCFDVIIIAFHIIFYLIVSFLKFVQLLIILIFI